MLAKIFANLFELIALTVVLTVMFGIIWENFLKEYLEKDLERRPESRYPPNLEETYHGVNGFSLPKMPSRNPKPFIVRPRIRLVVDNTNKFTKTLPCSSKDQKCIPKPKPQTKEPA